MNLDRGAEQAALERACGGDGEAFAQLRAAYEDALFGFLRARAEQDADAQDLAEETWAYVRRKLSTYRPERASFYTFVRIWARQVLVRYFHRQRDLHRREVLLSDLWALHPEERGSDEDLFDSLQPTGTAGGPPPVALEVEARLLRLTFAEGGYPWQLLAFGFSRLLEGWPPRRIAEQRSDTPLGRLLEHLDAEYRWRSRLTDEEVAGALAPLRAQMGWTVGRVLRPEDSVSRGALAALVDRPVGPTCLRAYYGRRGAEASISDWSDKIRRRVRRAWLREGSGGREESGAAL